MKINRHIILILSGLRIAASGFGQPDSLQRITWKGFVKDMAGAYAFGSFDATAFSQLIHNRISLSADITPRLRGRVELRNRVFSGSLLQKTPGFADAMDPHLGLIDLSHRWADRQHLLVLSEFDRAQLTYARDDWDVTLGRQRINWGMNNVWNPNDIFNAYNFLDFDYEERPGADALRLRYFAGTERTLEFALKPDKRPGDHIAAILYRFNSRGYDHQLLAAIHRRDIVLGTGWAGSIGETGFKGELSYFHPIEQFADTSGTLSASVMIDRTFPEETYVSASLWYNSRPEDMSGSLLTGTNRLSPKSLFPYRMAFHAGLVKGFGSRYTLAAALVFAPERATLILLPSMSCMIDESWDVDLTVQSYFAQEADIYRMSGGACFLRGRWSF